LPRHGPDRIRSPEHRADAGSVKRESPDAKRATGNGQRERNRPTTTELDGMALSTQVDGSASIPVHTTGQLNSALAVSPGSWAWSREDTRQ